MTILGKELSSKTVHISLNSKCQLWPFVKLFMGRGGNYSPQRVKFLGFKLSTMDHSDFMENSVCLQRVKKGFKVFCSCCLRILLRHCGNVDAHALYKENKKSQNP